MNNTCNSREVVFIKAKLGSDGGTDQYKKFAIDPNITNYNVLLGLLCKCFDINSDFSVCYLAVDEYGEQFYLPLQSDWDLDASIFTSPDSTIRLKVTLKPKSPESQDWDIIIPSDVQTNSRRSRSQQLAVTEFRGTELKGPSIFSQLSQRWEKTLANVRKAIVSSFRFDEDDEFLNSYTPLSDNEMKNYMDENGRIIYFKKFYRDVYLSGLDPSLRKVGWRILLSVCPTDTTGQERFNLLEIKSRQYHSLKENWKQSYASGSMCEQQLATLASISIDVVRTDWSKFMVLKEQLLLHDYYRNSDNHHRVCQLFDLLATYCIHHPQVGYNQGMSDLASPLLVVQNDEALAYLCFCALMQRVKIKFGELQQINLIQNMQHLYELLQSTDNELAMFFNSHNLSNMYFTHRWIVTELKREFNFDECLRLFEIQWATICFIKNDQENIETSNSKSEGYLVLKDSTICNHNLLPCEDNWKNCSARDISLINSLIGSNYVVNIPKYQWKTSVDYHLSINIPHCNNPISSSQSTQQSDQLDQKSQYNNNSCSHDQSQFNFTELNNDVFDFTDLTESDLSPDSSMQLLGKSSVKEYSKSLILNNFELTSEQSKELIKKLPPPNKLGQGNPFLLYLCLSLILEYKHFILSNVREPGDIIQFYQQQSGKHNVAHILYRARKLFNRYLEQQNFFLKMY